MIKICILFEKCGEVIVFDFKVLEIDWKWWFDMGWMVVKLGVCGVYIFGCFFLNFWI